MQPIDCLSAWMEIRPPSFRRDRAYPAQETLIHDEAHRRPVFLAANFSLGIAVLNHLVRQAVQAWDLNSKLRSSKFTTAVKQMRPVAQPSSWLGRRGVRLPMARKPSCSGWNDALRGEAEIGTAAYEVGRLPGSIPSICWGIPNV